MKKSAIVLLAVVALSFGAVACTDQNHSTSMGDTQQILGVCPGCGAKAPVDTYCEKCKAVAVAEVKTFTCAKCKKEVKEGTWCAEHNCFRFENTEMKCPKSGMTVVKGAFCKKCSGYHGLPLVKYNAETKVPYVVKK